MSLVSLTIFLLIFSFSPLKLSLFLSLVSVLMSSVCYSLTGSIFVSSALVISFSSGMMILFSYCAMITNYQTKNKMFSVYVFLAFSYLIFCFLVFSSLSKESVALQDMSLNLTVEVSSLLFLMGVVFFSMFNMNKTYFNPTKKFMQSY